MGRALKRQHFRTTAAGMTSPVGTDMDPVLATTLQEMQENIRLALEAKEDTTPSQQDTTQDADIRALESKVQQLERDKRDMALQIREIGQKVVNLTAQVQKIEKDVKDLNNATVVTA